MDNSTLVSKETMITETFDYGYLDLVKKMVKEGSLQKSRNGDTVELLNFRTEIKNPSSRCVGGYGRNINIFFLLYEAIWIWLGEKSVAPLTIFNSNMSNFSDDGKVFHAPYGYRIRSYGLPSDKDFFSQQLQAQGLGHRIDSIPSIGEDQLVTALMQLDKNPDDRRVVMSIWNPLLDSGFSCKDIPCNDMLMFKIREDKLHITIQNRSNDVHWGLPTNVFQFSFILELMSLILKKEMGTQVHNSQSLHVYLTNPITLTMLANADEGKSLYKYLRDESNIDFSFIGDTISTRLLEMDNELRKIYEDVLRYNDKDDKESLHNLSNHYYRSDFFTVVSRLLMTYVKYKKSPKKDEDKVKAISEIEKISSISKFKDMRTLGINFFVQRIENKENIPLEYKKYDF